MRQACLLSVVHPFSLLSNAILTVNINSLGQAQKQFREKGRQFNSKVTFGHLQQLLGSTVDKGLC